MTASASPAQPDSPPADGPEPGGYRELIALSLPLVLSSSFATVQIFIDRVFIARVGEDATAAAMPAVAYFWTPFALLFFTVMYATVFVAQYGGAKRPHRIGPVVWQAIYFGVAAGLVFPLLIPAVDLVIAGTGHSPTVQRLEAIYFRGLCFAALPMLIVAAVTGFFGGRGESWTVLLINSVGSAVNALLAIPLIRLQAGDPERAMFGAGLAAALGSTAAAGFGLALVFRKPYREEFATLRGWRFEAGLFNRLLKYGLPNGLQWMIEGLAFTAFILIVGKMGTTVGAACTIALSLNMLTFLPVMGLGQGVEILVGKRQGEKNPDLSAKTTWTGAKLAVGYMVVVGIVYALFPVTLTLPFAAEMDPGQWAAVAPLIPVLLRFVALYSVTDGLNIILAYALRGAGDTRFVVLVAVILSWPLMVAPTYLVYRSGLGVEWAWASATLYLAATAAVYVWRFRGGKWRTMTVIEPAVELPDVEAKAEQVDAGPEPARLPV
jgi:MATE family multidrug resistance protein